MKAECYCCDVSDFDKVAQLVATVKEEFGGIDILVNNAGINRDKLAMQMKEADFDDVIATNLKGAFNTIRQVYPLMVRKRSDGFSISLPWRASAATRARPTIPPPRRA